MKTRHVLLYLVVLAAVVVLAITSTAATVTGHIPDRNNVAIRAQISFQAKARPLFGPGEVRPGTVVKTTASTNGDFSIYLLPGDYDVQTGYDPLDKFTISVPDDTNTYTIDTLATDAPTYSTYRWWTNFFREGTNMHLEFGQSNVTFNSTGSAGTAGTNGGTVTSVGASSTWLSISGSPITAAGTLTFSVPYLPLASNATLFSWGSIGTNALTGKLASNANLGGWGTLPTNSMASTGAVATAQATAVTVGTNYTDAQLTTRLGANTVAIGNSAAASGNFGIAVGKDAQASDDNTVAIGANAIAQNSNSVAIGAAATTSSDNQIMLGSSVMTVQVDGVLQVGNTNIVAALASKLRTNDVTGPGAQQNGDGTITILSGGGSGEVNYNGEASVTNATRIGLVAGKSGATNTLRSLTVSGGLLVTNQGTNVNLALPSTLDVGSTNVAQRLNELTEATNRFVLSDAGSATNTYILLPTLSAQSFTLFGSGVNKLNGLSYNNEGTCAHAGVMTPGKQYLWVPNGDVNGGDESGDTISTVGTFEAVSGTFVGTGTPDALIAATLWEEVFKIDGDDIMLRGTNVFIVFGGLKSINCWTGSNVFQSLVFVPDATGTNQAASLRQLVAMGTGLTNTLATKLDTNSTDFFQPKSAALGTLINEAANLTNSSRAVIVTNGTLLNASNGVLTAAQTYANGTTNSSIVRQADLTAASNALAIAHTSIATAATQTIDMSANRTFFITNVLGSDVAVTLSNFTQASSCLLSVKSDVSARTISFISQGGASPIWLNTNGTSAATNLYVPAGKRAFAVIRSVIEGATTNAIIGGAIVQP